MVTLIFILLAGLSFAGSFIANEYRKDTLSTILIFATLLFMIVASIAAVYNILHYVRFN